MKLKPLFALLMATALMLGSLAPAAAAPALGEIFEGTVTAIDEEAGTLTLELEDGTSLVVTVPEDFDFTTTLLGDTVRVNGEVQDDGSVLAEEIENETGEDAEDGEETEDGEESDDPALGFYCNGSAASAHPMATRLAASYEVTVEWVMSYFCGGMGFGQIMLALMTAQSQGIDAESLLAARAEGEGWGQIWQGLGLTGRDRHNDDGEASEDGEDDKPGGGPPDHAGGPPPWAGGGDKDDKPGGGKPDKDNDDD